MIVSECYKVSFNNITVLIDGKHGAYDLFALLKSLSSCVNIEDIVVYSPFDNSFSTYKLEVENGITELCNLKHWFE